MDSERITELRKFEILKRAIMRLSPSPETCADLRDFTSDFLRHKLDVRQRLAGLDGRFSSIQHIMDGTCAHN